ncbi:acyltransferase [Niallia taxi]|uniref:acyltransferase n=1 Tax=Niallia taxi TaxID=2499688 RepID=UPI003D284822
MFQKILIFLLGLPNTLIFNFYYFKFKDAVKLPVFISHRVVLDKMKGKVIIEAPLSFGMIKFASTEHMFFKKQGKNSYWNVEGIVKFKGKANLNNGTKIRNQGELIIGGNFNISANTLIDCKKKIVFGDDVLIGWDCLFMDTDNHAVLDYNNHRINNIKEIIIGDRVWIGSKSTVLKGSKIGNDVVVAANSCVLKEFNDNNCIIGGYPAKKIKDNTKWRIKY